MQTQISVRISVETAQALDAFATETGKSKASIVEQALKEFLSRQPPPERVQKELNRIYGKTSGR
jgi:predicted transcriptional regulator